MKYCHKCNITYVSDLFTECLNCKEPTESLSPEDRSKSWIDNVEDAITHVLTDENPNPNAHNEKNTG